jgi:8-oxo-dGTP diphosphatase
VVWAGSLYSTKCARTAGDVMVGYMLERPTSLDETVTIELSVRVIPFAVGSDGLEVALCRAPGPSFETRLPSGQLRREESLTDCAARIARETLSIPPDYLEQLYTFSVAGPVVQAIVAYSAILSADTRSQMARHSGAEFRHADTLGGLSEVDRGILDYAKMRLRAKLGYSNIGFYFLPEEFTLSDLQDVYESVIGDTLDKRNFRRRVMAAGIVEAVGAKRPTSHRPASLYRFAGGDPATDALTPGDTDWSL